MKWETVQKDLAIAAGEAAVILVCGLLLTALVVKLLSLIALGSGGPKTALASDGASPDQLPRSAAILLRIKKAVKRAGGALTVLVVLGISAFNAYLIFKRQSVVKVQLAYLDQISDEMRQRLAFGVLKILLSAWACSLLLSVVHRILTRGLAFAKQIGRAKPGDESIERLFESLGTFTDRCVWLGFAWVAAWTLGVPEAALDFLVIGIKVYVIVAVGKLLWRTLDVVITTLEHLGSQAKREEGLWLYYDQLEYLVPVGRRSLEYAIYVSFATMAVSQVDFVASIAEWGPRVIRVIGYFFVARVIVAVVTVTVDEWAARQASNNLSKNQRLLTLVPLFQSVQKYAIYFCVAVAILDALGFDVGPILAGAGIAGVAVGFGAQSVIKDLVTGFFILFENYFVVGDFVQIGDVRGTVMGVDLRTTRLRDAEGGVHIIPNGDVQHVVHYSKDYSNAVVDVGVSYDADLDHVRTVLIRTGAELAASDERVMAGTEVLGLQNLGESDVVFRTLTKARPGRHFEVARAVREAIKRAFDAEGIEIPFARRVLIFQDERGKDVSPPRLK